MWQYSNRCFHAKMEGCDTSVKPTISAFPSDASKCQNSDRSWKASLTGEDPEHTFQRKKKAVVFWNRGVLLTIKHWFWKRLVWKGNQLGMAPWLNHAFLCGQIVSGCKMSEIINNYIIQAKWKRVIEVPNILAEQNRIKYLAEWSRIKNQEHSLIF